MAIREGLWNCSNCSTEGIKGRLKTCPECGDPRNPSKTPEEAPYLPNDAAEVTDPELLDLANAGPDWSCRYCSRTNRGDAERCQNCGHPSDTNDDFNEAKTYVDGVRVTGSQFGPYEARPEDPEEPAETVSDDIVEDQPLSFMEAHGTKLVAAAVAAVLVVVAIFVYSHFISTTSVKLEVANLEWNRQVEVEIYKTLNEEDWDIPSGGREVRSFQDVDHYVHVIDHYEDVPYTVSEQVQSGSHPETVECGTTTVDKGNGFFETETKYCTETVTDYRTDTHTEYRSEPVYRSDPVYRTKYEYQIERWVTDHWENASGDSGEFSDKLHWPEPHILTNNQRVGDGRTEKYIVTLTGNEDRSYTQEPGYDIWSKLNKGQTITGEVNQSGDLRSVDWP